MSAKRNIQEKFYYVYKRIIAISDFENWLYENDEIEDFLGYDLYLKLISINYKDKYAYEEVIKIIFPFINFGLMETERISNLLHNIINCKSIYNIMSVLYDDYCNGYYFLRYLGLSFVTSGLVESIGVEGVERNLINHIESYRKEASRLLGFLEKGEIKIINEYEYKDYRDEKDRIELTDIEKMMSE